MATFKGFEEFEYVSPAELRDALAKLPNNSDRLDVLQKAVEAQKGEIDELAADLRNQEYSEELEKLWRKLAEDRNALDARFDRLAGLASRGHAPSDETIEELFRKFEERYDLSADTSDQILKLTERVDEVAGIANEARDLADKNSDALTKLHTWLKSVLHIGDDDTDWDGPNRFDEIDERFDKVSTQIGTVNTRVDGIDQRLLNVEEQLRRQNSFSVSTLLITTVVLMVIGGLVGLWINGAWVAGGIIGAIIGGIIGFALGARKSRRPSTPAAPTGRPTRTTTRP